MYFEDATKDQLIQIVYFEECPIDYKYEAARELQLRKWDDEMLTDLVRLWGEGENSFQISIELGIPETTVRSRLFKYQLWGKRVIS